MRTHRRRGGGQRWREHNSTRQAQILEAAVALIEDNDPSVEVSIQQIAERAGLARSVVYRQFDNRDDLDSRVREYILEKYIAQVEAVLVLDPAKTLEQIIFEAMRTVVHWAAEHPKLYQFGQSGSVHGHAAGETSLTIGRHRVAETLWEKFRAGSALLGIEVAEYRPVVYGLVGLVEGIVTQYIGMPAAERPDQETIARLLTSSAWHLYTGHAADRGFHFERTATIADSLAVVLAAATGRAD